MKNSSRIPEYRDPEKIPTDKYFRGVIIIIDNDVYAGRHSTEVFYFDDIECALEWLNEEFVKMNHSQIRHIFDISEEHKIIAIEKITQYKIDN